jgi:hypothetical protein
LTAEYAQTDGEVVDYQIYCLDPHVLDRETGASLLLRGPRPGSLDAGRYFACLGAAQTFGRFCPRPFPTLLGERLGLDVLNLGRGGAGPSFFSEENDGLIAYVNRARFAIVQVMAGRSESNSLFLSKGLGYYTRVADGTSIGCDEAYRELLEQHDAPFVRTIVEETRANWIRSYRRLLSQIRVPTIMLWFSMRAPDYVEEYRSVEALFGDFPQLVNRGMVEEVRASCTAYVESVSRRGMPHRLVSRRNGEPVTVSDPWGGEWSTDWYYGSPDMHVDAAAALEPACAAILRGR